MTTHSWENVQNVVKDYHFWCGQHIFDVYTWLSGQIDHSLRYPYWPNSPFLGGPDHFLIFLNGSWLFMPVLLRILRGVRVLRPSTANLWAPHPYGCFWICILYSGTHDSIKWSCTWQPHGPFMSTGAHESLLNMFMTRAQWKTKTMVDLHLFSS